MKCSEPKPGSSYEECERDLAHSGDHEYLRTRWPRPRPADVDWDVEDVTLAGARSLGQGREWGLNEREFLITFEVTNRYVIPVSAETEDAALRQFEDYCDFPDFSREHAVDGGIEVRRPTVYERAETVSEPIGPKVACPDCGRLSFHPRWMHNPYRKCHGPIQWREGHNGRPYREFAETPAHSAPKAVA